MSVLNQVPSEFRKQSFNPMELSIVMPCLNEAETIEICIQKANNFLDTNNIDGEVVVGDNGSTDGSQQIAKKNGARDISISKKGDGAALQCEIAATKVNGFISICSRMCYKEI